MMKHTTDSVKQNNNDNTKGGTFMGNIDVLALLKYLWAAFIPVVIKGWSMVDKRFEQTEHKVVEIDKRVSDMSSDVKVLVERSENQQKNIEEIKDLLTKLLLDNKNK
ncbi:hypothetical protein S140_175 [Shewanella sp. phage 1/40]|uniref:hypothetical protein n=1 Tax=Shewanella phage 1/4 TaxID=1458859 RepID=UPI0004F5A83D|nr:hypothetical protein S14_172 [Shewanella sp. phage 1/4]YP_009104173.1 hypothetical protein S140_175 [Shewanella sp. phage 1/40]AHK11281.1 hypothetical protein S14_172 [Shewanella sp. phage 1/4]AHK11582.1 hypothetical protein S140_175 [Shewanella sp. phage 1/40]